MVIPDKSRLQSTENYLEVKAQEQRKSLYNDKEWNPYEVIAILNVYATNNWTAEYVNKKQKELKRTVNKSIVLLEDFKHLSPTIDRTIRKLAKDIEELNNNINQQDLA